ncbi:30S ribosomal protein S13 [Candidatus Parcubacteria bacterium]|nr:MAG: 30S ribosomal protein S13 [Candidatus Parcubacteria bacterium]
MRVAGVTIPDGKRLFVALRRVYGIGKARALAALHQASVDPYKRVEDLTPEEEAAVRTAVESFAPLEGDLKREISANIRRLKDTQSYRGLRHARGLPVRGQRTKTNARTRKGPRKTMTSGRRKVEKK